MTLKAPFPYFGGKSRIARVVWQRFGDPAHYVEPFAGSLAVLLGRPSEPRTETVCDVDGLLSNFWRAVKTAPDEVARWADDPVNEVDLHARHLWLVRRKPELLPRLLGDPDYFDPQAAGWWVWGISSWIGGGWCSGIGPWTEEGGVMVKAAAGSIVRQIPEIASTGRGVHRQLPRVSDLGNGVHRLVSPADIGPAGAAPIIAGGIHQPTAGIYAWFLALSARLRRVRVVCGDWTRIMGPSVLTHPGLCAVFLDPPYPHADRDEAIYAHDEDVAPAVRAWATEHGDDPLVRIALCGYDTPDAQMPDGWTAYRWKAHGGYGVQGDGRGRENAYREIVWFSRYCLKPEAQQGSLFDLLQAEETVDAEQEDATDER